MASAKDACPIADFGEMYHFIMEHKLVFFPILFLLGLILAFFGFKLNKFTFFVTGMLLGSALVLLFCVDFVLNKDSEKQTRWICFFVSIMSGILLGYMTVVSRKIGTFAIGGWLGYIVSLLVYSAFLYKIETSIENLVLYIANGVGIILFGLIGFSMYDQIIIISSSLGGSFAAVFAIGMLAGKFPNIYALA